jgi:hypothetical protein
MTEVEKLRKAQNFIARELQKKGTGRVDAVNWGQGPQDVAAGIYQLAVFRGSEKSVFTFSKFELLENYGSKQWEKQLRGHISDILVDL